MSPQCTKKIPVCVVIPVKNEEINLRKCLDRLNEFGEIIVVDSHSDDGTVDVAKSYGVKIIEFNWNGKYPKKRNWFLLNYKPIYDWVLFLDADEYVTEKFCKEVMKKIDQGNKNAYWIRYHNYFLGKRLRFGLPQRKLSLFRVGKALYERVGEGSWSQLDMEIHEHPIVDGDVGEITEPIDHQDYKGLEKFIDRHHDYALWETWRYMQIRRETYVMWKHFTNRQRFKYRNFDKWWYPWFYFIYAYLIRGGILDGRAGFYYAVYKTWYCLTIRLLIQEKSSDYNDKPLNISEDA